MSTSRISKILMAEGVVGLILAAGGGALALAGGIDAMSGRYWQAAVSLLASVFLFLVAYRQIERIIHFCGLDDPKDWPTESGINADGP
jgi:hypothetical protein